MPTDNRRLHAPDESYDPSTYMPEKSKSVNKPQSQLKSRCSHDGRKNEQLRPIYIKPGINSQAKGSAYLEMGETKILCAVYGPREVTRRDDFSMKGQLTCEIKFATFSCATRRQHQQDNQEKDLSAILEGALQPAVCLDKYPKAKIDVFVSVLQNDGAVLAGAMSCASVALAQAGIEMYDLVVGYSLRQLHDTVLLDPTDEESYDSYSVAPGNAVNNGEVTVGYMPSLNQVSAISQSGELEAEICMKAVRTCISQCQKLYPVLQQALTQSIQSKVQPDNT